MVDTIRKNSRTASFRRAGCTAELRARVRDWVEREIKFIDDPVFSVPTSAAVLAASRPESLSSVADESPSGPGVTFVSGLVAAPLLSQDEERYLFKWMNFLKFRAEQSRQRLNLNRPDGSLVDRIEADLREATAVRNRIVGSNLRLIVALARKLSDSLDQMSDLIGEATVPLIRAVELFDVGLGNRFSTYATWAVRNHMLRCLKKRQANHERFTNCNDQSLEGLVDFREEAREDQGQQQKTEVAVHELLTHLSDREQAVIKARFGLGGQPAGQSLQDIAEQIGLSKERVRQIALAAIDKLRGVVKATGSDDFQSPQ